MRQWWRRSSTVNARKQSMHSELCLSFTHTAATAAAGEGTAATAEDEEPAPAELDASLPRREEEEGGMTI